MTPSFRRATALCASVTLVTLAPTARAQIVPAPSTPPPAAPTTSVYRPIHIGGLTIAGSIRMRGEDWNWFEAPNANGSYTYGHALVRLGATYSNPRVDVMVEGS